MDYKGPIEAALSTDLRGEPYNFSLWDINTGTQLVVFKGNKANPIAKCLQLIDNNYFIAATDNVLQIWSIFNKKCQDQKIFLPSRPSVLCMSPCGNFLIAGISEMIYIWQLYSGNLLSHTQRHYQAVSVLKLNQEGTFLFSGGEDGVVLVWPFADLISHTHNTGALNLSSARRDVGVNEPRFIWQHHSAQVTDLHISNSGLCISTSTDMTANVYNYTTGKRLYCITMPAPIWSIVMNKNETRIFLGSQDGSIYETAVSSVSLSLINSKGKDGEAARKPAFIGHKGKIIGLLISLDGSKLVSASIDCSCKIWDINQKKLLQDIKHQAPLANLTSLLVPDALALSSMTQSQVKPPLAIKPLKRNLYKPPRDTALMDVDLFEEATTTVVNVRNKINHWTISPINSETSDRMLDITSMLNSHRKQKLNGKNGETLSRDKSDSESLSNLKEKLKSLYMLSVEKVFQDAAHESLQPYTPMVEKILNEKMKKEKGMKVQNHSLNGLSSAVKQKKTPNRPVKKRK